MPVYGLETRRQQAVVLHPLQHRIQRPGPEPMTVPRQLLHQPRAVHLTARGM
jgi:hypothetical protein